jgi:hypothetical protein
MLLPKFVAAVAPHSPDVWFPASVHLSGRIGKATGHIGLCRSYHHTNTSAQFPEIACHRLQCLATLLVPILSN